MRRLAFLFLVVGTVSLWPQTSESELFAEAESRYLGKNYAAALDAYDGFLKRYPLADLSSDVQYRKAVCLYRLQRYSESYQLLGDVATKYRSTRYYDFVPLWQGLDLYELKSYARAVETLDVFLSRAHDPELTPQALLYKALSLVAMGEDTQAAEPLRDLAKSYRGAEAFPYAAVLLSSLLRREKSFDELLQFTGGIDLSHFPKNWKDQLMLSRAEGLWEKGSFDEAEAIYKSLTEGEPDVALTAYRRLFAAAQRRQDLTQMQDLTLAAESRFAATPGALSDLWARVGAEAFRRGAADVAELFFLKVWNLRRTQPVEEVVPLYLAEIALTRRDPVAARAILEEYTSGPGAGSANAVMRLGDIALQTGDLPSAEKYYARFISAFPRSARFVEAGYFLAYVTYKEGKDAESFQLATRFLQSAGDSPFRKDLIRLRIMLLKKDKSYQEAASSLTEYIALYPDDARSRIDLLKALFVLKDFPRIVKEADALMVRFPRLETDDPYAYLLASYLRGLAMIIAKDYRGAVRNLEAIQPDAVEKAGVSSILPYARYYLGWAYVKNAGYDQAAKTLDALAVAFPRHELTPRILFLAGWSHFSLGEFEVAAGYFSRTAGLEGDKELVQRSLYLHAKSLLNAKKLPEASAALLRVINASPPSPFADSAMFDYSVLLDAQGSPEKAADSFRALTEKYPSSPLVEEALYSRGETYLTHDMYAEARTAFSDYRLRFPKGKLFDAALYWGGVAAQEAGEKFAAVVLWEQLVSGYRESSFRAAGLKKTADIYIESRDFPKALALYTRYMADYPEEARANDAGLVAERLQLQISGMGDREAELTARMDHESGSGRADAMAELAGLYVLGGGGRVEQGYQMLQKVIAAGEPRSASRAQYLAGEYFYRKGDLGEASRQFLASAVTGSAEPDQAASAVFRAAEMMKLAGRQDEVKALVKRLVDNFPSSGWAAKGKKLLTEGKQ